MGLRFFSSFFFSGDTDLLFNSNNKLSSACCCVLTGDSFLCADFPSKTVVFLQRLLLLGVLTLFDLSKPSFLLLSANSEIPFESLLSMEESPLKRESSGIL